MVTVAENFNIRHHNTFAMDVTCRNWVEYTSESDVWQLADELSAGQAKCIGEGSNLLFTCDYTGSLLHSRIMGMDVEMTGRDMLITAGAGMHFDDLVAHTAAACRSGLENLTDIPGHVGAAAVQNIGAYGVEAKDVIESVRCIDTRTRRIAVLPAAECAYGYRESLFKHESDRFIVTAVTFRLYGGAMPRIDYGNLRERLGENYPTPQAVRDAVREIRAEKLPPLPEVGSAGSFFKNPVVTYTEFDRIQDIARREWGDDTCVPHYILPDSTVKIPAAWLIERCGWKGKQLGKAGVWHRQPLILVNLGGASPADIIELENHVISGVSERFGIHLSPEVEHIA